MTNLAPHRIWSWPIRVGVATGALALMVVLGRVLVMTPSAEAHADTTFTLLYSFQGASDGANPYDGVVLDAAGNLYGTTKYGGYPCIPSVGCGTVFKLDTTGTKAVLYAFRGQPLDGNYPQARLLRDAAGNLYGTTIYGGSSRCRDLGCGTVFKADTSGNETVLYKFTGRPGGRYPSANLVRDAAGNLYGTTSEGGGADLGTVFKLDRTGKETVLHSFTGGADGTYPIAGLLRDPAGNLYGTTTSGGASACNPPYGCGTVFKLDTTGVKIVLYSFTGVPDGYYPAANLVRDAAGNLYGTTAQGGASECNPPYGCGTVFKVDTSGNETVLYRFTGPPDGRYPGALLRDATGNLYGTTGYGGVRDKGTVFKLDTTGNETVLHSFTARDGQQPTAGLVMDAAGNLYGTTIVGGDFRLGTVFKLSR